MDGSTLEPSAIRIVKRAGDLREEWFGSAATTHDFPQHAEGRFAIATQKHFKKGGDVRSDGAWCRYMSWFRTLFANWLNSIVNRFHIFVCGLKYRRANRSGKRAEVGGHLREAFHDVLYRERASLCE